MSSLSSKPSPTVCRAATLLRSTPPLFCAIEAFHAQPAGFIRQPKWGHRRDLHNAIQQCEEYLVSSDPTHQQLGVNIEVLASLWAAAVIGSWCNFLTVLYVGFIRQPKWDHRRVVSSDPTHQQLGVNLEVDKEEITSWVLSFQAHPRNKAELNNGQLYGFHGSRISQFPPDENGVLIHNGSHLASTYCALAILKIVGFNFLLIDSESILTSMRNLQQPDGSFMPIKTGAEMDLRFIYCAAAICFMLGDWSGMDKEMAKDYIVNCQSYDGGFGLIPGSESHVTRGATYCAVASLRLMGGYIENDILSESAPSSVINVPLLLDWSLQRQAADGGFQGRSNKTSDTCYAFWIGGVLRILGAHKFIDKNALHSFLLTCQFQYGGFSKFPGQLPDLYHSYYGFSAFSMLEEPGLNLVCFELGVTDIAAIRI